MKKLFKALLFLAVSLFSAEVNALPYNKPAPLDGLSSFTYVYDFQHDKYKGGIGFSHGSNVTWSTVATYQNFGNAMNLFYNQWRDGILRPTIVTGGIGYIGRCTDYGCWDEGGPNGDTNWLLQSRILNNAAWTASNATVIRSAIIGADNVSGNGNQITFNANNGTVSQAIVFPGKLDNNNSSTILAGGTGYVTGDKVTFDTTGGTCTTAPIGTVTASGGIVSKVVWNSSGDTVGSCSVLPTSPLTQASTTGSGTGLQVTPFWRTGTASAWVKCVTCTGAIYVNANGCGTTNNVASQLLTTQYLQVRAPTVSLANNTFCIQGANANDVIDVDFTQFEDDDQATSPIVTTAATITRGPENYYLSYTGSVYNAGVQLLAAVQAGTPFSMVFEYSGNFSTTLVHGILTTDSPVEVIGGVGSSPVSLLLQGSGGTTLSSTNNDATGLYLTSPGNTGTVNKVAVSANGGVTMICVNGVPTIGSGKYIQLLGGSTHNNILNNGSNLVPVNGWMSLLAMDPKEMTLGQCIQNSTIINNQ